MKLPGVLLIFLILYSLPFFISDQLISPDDLIYSHFSSHLARTGNLAYYPPGDGVHGLRGFIPRYFVYHRGGELTLPRKFPGFIFFWAFFKRLLPAGFARLVNPFLGVLALLLLYLIARRLFEDGKGALSAVIILATTPLFIHRTYMYNPTLFNLVFFFASLYFLLRALQEGGILAYLLFGGASGMFLWIRPTNPVYLVGLFLFFLIERRRVRPRRLLGSVLLITFFAGGLLLYNRIFFGSFLNLGYTVTHTPPVSALGSKLPLSFNRLLDYLSFHPKIWILHLKISPLALSLGFPLLALAIIGIFINSSSESRFRFSSCYLYLLALSLLFFANFATYGHEKGELTLHSSFLRYLMPVIALLPLFVARVISRLNFPLSRCLAILVLFNLLIALVAPSGVIETVTLSRYYQACHRFLLEEIEPETVFVSYYWDKLLFPERMVYTHGSHFPGSDMALAVESLIRAGKEVATSSHPNDQEVLAYLRKRCQLEEAEGPQEISPLLRASARQAKLYPLRVYKVVPEKAVREEEDRPHLPRIFKLPEEFED